MGYWGRHFGRQLVGSRWQSRHFGRHFPEGREGVPPIAPATAATLILEANARVTFAWKTGIEKSFDGTEKRAGFNDDPAIRFEGDAYLLGGEVRELRGKLARLAASGAAFSLGLPFEELPLRA